MLPLRYLLRHKDSKLVAHNRDKITSSKGAAALRWTIIAIAGLLIIMGILQGDAVTVLRKAIIICYECIGVG